MKPNTLAPGTVLQERYIITRLLGHGGMGAVYQAVDRRIKANCAIKETFFQDRAGIAQFEREACLLAALRHPHIPRVSDYFEENGCYYLVMEYIPGQHLGDWIKKNGLPEEPQVYRWARHLLSALDYVHSRQPPIIHRDIKPANIKITPDGHAVLVDFGIAKRFTPHDFTTMGAKAISPGYSPPEQYAHNTRTNAQSDIYSLGATLYFALTGHAPIEAPQRSMRESFPPPSRFRHISPTLDQVVMRALALEPRSRWPDARTMYMELSGESTLPPAKPRPRPPAPQPPVISQPVCAASSTTSGNTSSFAIIGLVLALIVVLGLTIVAGLNLFGGNTTPTPSIFTPAYIATAASTIEIGATPLPEPPSVDREMPATATPAPQITRQPTATASDGSRATPASPPSSDCTPRLPTLVEPVESASKYAWQEVTFKWEGGQRCSGLWQVTLNGIKVCPAVADNTVTCVLELAPGEYTWRVELQRNGTSVQGMMTSAWTLYLTEVGGHGTCPPDESTKPDCGPGKRPTWNTETCSWECRVD